MITKGEERVHIMGKKIAIVGAGISGLLACKYVLSKGFHPVVFESQDRIGGVWVETFEMTKLQTPKPVYQFSDFPWPSSVEDEFPDHRRVLEYLEAYARRFDLVRHVRFGSKVVGIRYDGASAEEMEGWRLWGGGDGEAFGSSGKWEVKVERKVDGSDTAIEVSPIVFISFRLCLLLGM